MKVLEAVEVRKKFHRKEILHGIDITLEEGEIVGFVGPNGAGKSTFIKSVLGLYHLDGGSIRICDYDVKKDFEKALRNVGCIVENPDMYQNISGWKNLEICALMNGISHPKNLEVLVKLVHLEEAIHHKVKTYSLGMKQRLGLAQALLNHPKLLILDEPTNGLDPLGIKELREILKQINEEYKMTIFISSHILSEIENVCDRVILIQEGKIVENILVSDIKDKNISLEDEFLTKTLKQDGE